MYNSQVGQSSLCSRRWYHGTARFRCFYCCSWKHPSLCSSCGSASTSLANITRRQGEESLPWLRSLTWSGCESGRAPGFWCVSVSDRRCELGWSESESESESGRRCDVESESGYGGESGCTNGPCGSAGKRSVEPCLRQAQLMITQLGKHEDMSLKLAGAAQNAAAKVAATLGLDKHAPHLPRLLLRLLERL